MEFRFRFCLQTILTEFRTPCNPLTVAVGRHMSLDRYGAAEYACAAADVTSAAAARVVTCACAAAIGTVSVAVTVMCRQIPSWSHMSAVGALALEDI